MVSCQLLKILLGFGCWSFASIGGLAVALTGMVFVPTRAEAKLKSDYRGFEVLTVGGEVVLMLLPGDLPSSSSQKSPSQQSLTPKTSILVSGRLESLRSSAEMDEDTALLLEAEMMELSGAGYDLPQKRSELLNVIGLSTSGEESRSDEEWIELIRVHMERSLSITPTCSEFLVAQLGLRASQATLSPALDASSADRPMSTESLQSNSVSHVELAPMDGVSSAEISPTTNQN